MKLGFGASRAAIAAVLFFGGSAAHAQAVLTPVAVPPTTAADPDPQGPTPGDDIIVTGTRATGVTAAESPAPIKVLGAEELSHVGQPNLNQVLTQLVPSFVAQAFGGDAANLTLSARLRGLSPNHTLVLVNGKRRHGTANLAVLGGPYQGAATADLDLISPASIKRIEVLEQGAAAQYGSDAIAGVINIILKDDSEGGDGSFTAGQHYGTGGETYAGSLHLAQKIGDAGFFNITGFYRFHDFTQIGGLDRRVTDTNGTLRTNLTALQAQLYPGMKGFPYVNPISGDARSNLTNLQYNTAYDFGGVEVYSFGSYSRRIASAKENVRVPTRVSRTVNGVTTYFDPEGDNPVNGFVPRIKLRQDDYAFTGGARGTVSGFRYDLSATLGRDKNLLYTIDSANASLFADTGFTPSSFYNGMFKATEFTVNADFAKEFELGMAAPLNFAFGGEYRKNVYEIGPGDAGSIYKEGGQSYPGFRPSDAGVNSRHNVAAYGDVAAQPAEALKLDGAVRYEDYSDFGTRWTYKVTGRYDFSDAFALRGTVSTGFRAPTLAESFYSATNVSPTAAFVQLPANSAAAKLIGFGNLAPEKSTTYSAGLVLQPAPRLTITIDAYQVKVRDRILGTGSIFSAGGAINYAQVRNAVIANGNVLDPTVTQTGVSLFANGADTRTRGVDVVATYVSDFGDMGRVNWTLSGNYNQTDVTRIGTGPVLTGTRANGTSVTGPIPLFNDATISTLKNASPRVKLIASAFYTLDKFSATLRGTLFGKTSNLTSPDGGVFYEQRIGTAGIVDLEVNYKLTDKIELSVGANNLFDKRAPTVALVPGTTSFTLVNGGNQLDAPLTFSPYGINGGYYYGRINFSF